jgi:hypothetical protein
MKLPDGVESAISACGSGPVSLTANERVSLTCEGCNAGKIGTAIL